MSSTCARCSSTRRPSCTRCSRWASASPGRGSRPSKGCPRRRSRRIRALPARVRSPVTRGLLAVLVVGLFAGILRAPLMSAGLVDLARLLFTGDGLTVVGAVLVFTVVVVGRVVRQRVGVAERVAALPAGGGHSSASRDRRACGDHPGPTASARTLLRPGDRTGRPLYPDGLRPEHHPGSRRPARSRLRGVLRGRRVYGWPLHVAGGIRPARRSILGGAAVRDAVRGDLRCGPRPADPQHPR